MACWDEDADRPALVDLPAVCRAPGRTNPLEAPRLVPSAVHLLPADDFWTRVGRFGPLQRHVFWGRHAHIGRAAVERNEGAAHPAYVPTFKRTLAADPLQVVARERRATYTARDAARAFLRELFAQVDEATGDRIRDLVLCVPVDAFDRYRAELRHLATSLGVRRLRFVEEPVAAAIGYGLGLPEARRVLVVDFGGGTLHFALVDLAARDAEEGRCRVLAKVSRAIGGEVVDGWLFEHVASALHLRIDDALPEADLWRRLLLAEARRVKEALHFAPTATFSLSPPPELARFGRPDRPLDIAREALVALLDARGLYATLRDCADEVAAAALEAGHGGEPPQEVLLVGGSSLLPGVFSLFEARFGRERVRGWHPFEAVSLGAAAFAAGRVHANDVLVHDYAIVTHDPATNAEQHIVVVAGGTRIPTAADHWKRHLVPTCALGEPERIFKLVVCEIARGRAGTGAGPQIAWDAAGRLHSLDRPDDRVVVPLNAEAPAMGRLEPPHAPADRRPRLEVAFGVDADRWLCATVRDLRTDKLLMRGEPVVKVR